MRIQTTLYILKLAMRIHASTRKKRATQPAQQPSTHSLPPQIVEVQSSPLSPSMQEKSNEEGLADWKIQQEKWARMGTPWMEKAPNEAGPQPWLQKKLTLGKPGDKYEKEADWVASQVVQQINTPAFIQSNQEHSCQRQEEPEARLQVKRQGLDQQPSSPPWLQQPNHSRENDLSIQFKRQREPEMPEGEISADLAAAIVGAKGRGHPLDLKLQQSMGQAMSADFSGVRVHTDSQSDQLNRSIQAKAFTTGQDVFFRQGTYQPGHREGQALIAHELAHVIQQQGESVRLAPSYSSQHSPDQPIPSLKDGSTQPNHVRRYTETIDRRFNVSENGAFAVANAKYPSSIYAKDGEPMSLPGGLAWDNDGEYDINNETYTKYNANISKYESSEGPGSKQFCGQFARGLTDSLPGKAQSTSEVGGVLYDKDTSPGRDDGWENHYAAVVIKDGGDHATFETAVGIEEVWVGIYGTQKGQSFIYKTQEANIERLMQMPDIVIPGTTKMQKSLWDYLFCLPGKEVVDKEEVRIKMGITPEQAEQWRSELTAWRQHGTPAKSDYIKKVIEKLENEFN